jgi:hypothetical protein
VPAKVEIGRVVSRGWAGQSAPALEIRERGQHAAAFIVQSRSSGSSSTRLFAGAQQASKYFGPGREVSLRGTRVARRRRMIHSRSACRDLPSVVECAAARP